MIAKWAWLDSWIRRGISFSLSFKFGGERKKGMCQICGKEKNDHKSMKHPFEEETFGPRR